MSWQVIGASVIGTSHRRADMPCQDAHGYCVSKQGVVMAVADGLGSAKYAEQGAQFVVQQALGLLKRELQQHPKVYEWERIMKYVFSMTCLALGDLADSQQHNLKDYATTLLLAVATPHYLVTGQIGDGAIVGLRDEQMILISQPQRGEYANETYPLTAENALDALAITITEAVKAVAVFTDGLQHLSLNLAHLSVHRPFFAPFFTALQAPLDCSAISEQLANFLASERVCARTDDDKTLVIAVWH